MKLSVFFPATALLLTAGVAASAQQPRFSITLDERGNGTVQQDDGEITPLTSFLSSGPNVGPIKNVLTYNLLFQVTGGDLLLLEGTTGAPADLLRFTTNSTVYFYSDFEANEAQRELADVGLPSTFATSEDRIKENGPEGDNGATFEPQAGQSGRNPDASVTYRIISDVTDPVPEASTVTGMGLLLTLGCAGLILQRRRSAARS